MTLKTNVTFHILALTCVMLISCAGPKSVRRDPGFAKMALKPPPVLVASAEPVGLSPEEELLLEDWSEDPDSQQDLQDTYSVPDPLEKLNRATFYLNDKLYFWLLKPIAVGYRSVFPQPARTGVSNFFFNLKAPLRIVNNILQGKGEAAEAELARFLYNSTVGFLGLGDPAKKNPALNPTEEDLGQTLATYGISDGFYIVWPILGPSTLRDTVGFLGDGYLNPKTYIQPMEASLGLKIYSTINTLSFRIGDYESLKKSALDPYTAFRDGYLQLRRSKIRQ